MTALLAIDIGNTWIHVGILGIDGTIYASSSRSIPTQTLVEGWAEQDPQQWLAITVDLCQEVRAKYPTTSINAIGISGQSGVFIRGHRPALIGADRRHRDAGVRGTVLAQRLAWATQAHWEPGPLQLSTHGWLLEELGADRVIDLPGAGETGNLDPTGRAWDHTVTANGWELPDIRSAPSQVGTLNHLGANLLDVEEGIPLVLAPSGVVGLIDAFFGRSIGAGLIHLGPSTWLAAFVDTPESPLADNTVFPAFPGFSLASGLVPTPMAALDFARHTWLPNKSSREADNVLLAQGANVAASNLLMTEVATRTYGLIGLSEQTRSWQAYLAAYEHIAFQLAHHAQAIGFDPELIPLVGTVITHPIWPQLIADVFNRPVTAVRMAHAGLHACARSVAGALHWPLPAPLAGDGIRIHPGPRAKDYAVFRQAHAQLATQMGAMQWTG